MKKNMLKSLIIALIISISVSQMLNLARAETTTYVYDNITLTDYKWNSYAFDLEYNYTIIINWNVIPVDGNLTVFILNKENYDSYLSSSTVNDPLAFKTSRVSYIVEEIIIADLYFVVFFHNDTSSVTINFQISIEDNTLCDSTVENITCDCNCTYTPELEPEIQLIPGYPFVALGLIVFIPIAVIIWKIKRK